VLDSINSLSDQQDLRWWPAFLPKGITVLVSSLPGPTQDALKRKTEALPGQDKAPKWKTVMVRPLTKTQSTNLLNTYLAGFNKKLPRQLVNQVQVHPLATNPLFIRTLAEELRLFGVHEELEKRLDHYLTSQTIDDLFGRVLQRVEKDCGKKHVKAAMTAIWASRAGLTEKEIQGIAKLKPATWAPIRNALNDALLEANGRFIFSHDYGRIGVRNRYLGVKATRQRMHRELAQWFKERPADARRAEEEPYQWRAAEEWAELRGALTRADMFSAIISHRGQEELLAYWLELEDNELSRIEQAYQQAWPTMRRLDSKDGARLLGQLRDFLFFAGCYGNFVLRITRQRVVEFKQRPDLEGDLVESLNDLAALLFERSEFRTARGMYEEAITLIEKHPCAVSSDDEILYRSNYLRLISEMDDRRQAIASCRDLIELIDSNPYKFRKAKGHLASLRNQIGCDLTDLGDLATAERDIRVALKLNFESSGPINVDRSIYLNNLAAAMCAQGRDQEALTALVEALKISHQILGREHRDTRIRIINLAEFYRNCGDLVKAQVLLDELPTRRNALPNDQTLFSEMNTRALILRDLGRHREAMAHFLSLLDAQRATFSKDHSSVALTMHNIAAVKADQGDLRGAIELIETSLLTFERNGLLAYCASACENLAEYYEELNEQAATINALHRALSFLEAIHGVYCPQSVDVRYRLGNLIFEAGDHNGGLDLLTQELEIVHSESGKDSESVFRSLLNLGEKYYSIDRLEKAVSIYRRALRLARILHGKVSWETSVCAHRLAICLKEMGRMREANNFARLENEIDILLAYRK
jgi:tetratricopeptide (TPR) repeat protein